MTNGMCGATSRTTEWASERRLKIAKATKATPSNYLLAASWGEKKAYRPRRGADQNQKQKNCISNLIRLSKSLFEINSG